MSVMVPSFWLYEWGRCGHSYPGRYPLYLVGNICANCPTELSIDVQVCFWNLCSLLEFQTAFFTITTKKSEHCIGMRRTIRQGLVNRDRYLGKFFAVLVVRRPLFRLPPQVCKRI